MAESVEVSSGNRAAAYAEAPRVRSWGTVALIGCLVGVGGLLIALGVLRPGSSGSVTLGHLPLWLALVDVGVIVLASGVVVAWSRRRAPIQVPTLAPLATIPFPDRKSTPERPRTAPATGAGPATAIPSPPAPTDAEEPELPSPVGFLATLASERLSSSGLIEPVEPTVPVALSPPAPAPTEPSVPVVPTTSENTGPSCVRCGRLLSPPTAWRKCGECGRTLCASCFVENLRVYGRAVCDRCAASGPPGSA
ncbi:MAG: hypothetical protein L3K19_08375 [Thermoplasmata archaeon]|nr:hypothetical protein [Thermoplasmata archaeon]